MFSPNLSCDVQDNSEMPKCSSALARRVKILNRHVALEKDMMFSRSLSCDVQNIAN